MWIELKDEKSGRRLLLNVDATFCIVEMDKGVAGAISKEGHTVPLPIGFDDLRDEIVTEIDDDDPETH